MSFHKKNHKDNQLSENISASEKLMNDDFNIKSHLNSSLELKGINVSEELINKTLAAVKKDMEEQPLTRPVNNEETADTGKQIGARETAGIDKQVGARETAGISKQAGAGKAAWYRNTRIIAGAAAALIVFTVGLGVISNFGKYSPKYDTDSARSMVAEDSATESESTSDTSSATSSGTAGTTKGEIDYNADIQADQTLEKADAGTGLGTSLEKSDQIETDTDTNGSKAAAKDSSSAGSDTKTVAPENADDTQAPPKVSATFRSREVPATEIPEDTQMAVTDEPQDSLQGIASSLFQEESLSFSDILPVTCEEISSVKITDLLGNREVTLTLQEEIQSFYSALEQQKLVKSTLAPTPISNYTIELTNMQGTLYSITIGEVITVNTTTEAVANQSFYNPLDTTALLKVIEDYFK